MRALAMLAAISLSLAALVTAMANAPAPLPRSADAPGIPIFEGDFAEPAARTPTRHEARRPSAPKSAFVAKPLANPLSNPLEAARTDTLFVNTYYDFPTDRGGPGDTPLYTARCEPITQVSRAFHDRLCVQGSGRLSSGETVSFALRDCACAEICPRTGQRICYEKLDPERFPHGRGAMGHPITPLSTVAVDPAVIPLDTSLFIPEFAGVPRPDGTPHDGCFVAEDRGIKITGHRIDVFTGEPDNRLAWEAFVPSNRGVHVLSGAGRCAGGRPRSGAHARRLPPAARAR